MFDVNSNEYQIIGAYSSENVMKTLMHKLMIEELIKSDVYDDTYSEKQLLKMSYEKVKDVWEESLESDLIVKEIEVDADYLNIEF